MLTLSSSWGWGYQSTSYKRWDCFDKHEKELIVNTEHCHEALDISEEENSNHFLSTKYVFEFLYGISIGDTGRYEPRNFLRTALKISQIGLVQSTIYSIGK